VLLVESQAKGSALPYHRQKLVLVLSAMHHFAQELRDAGYEVHLENAASYAEGIRAKVAELGSAKVVALEPREWGLDLALREADLGAPLELLPDGGQGGHFLLSRGEFLDWAAQQRKRGKPLQLRMDAFYRFMRKRTGLLMDGEKPEGGEWSYDSQNRKKIPSQAVAPDLPSFARDEITEAQIERVAEWSGHWGEAGGFSWPVTRAQALAALEAFVVERLPSFGDYQDGMRAGETFLWHACLSPAMNLGLLHPEEVAEAAVRAYREGDAPLNAVEGFVRQVIGWREFIRGVYWLRMPELRSANLLGASRRLPSFYWKPEQTEMRCVRESAQAVLDHGYAHHIQRLMVLGNFALLADVEPLEISHWFWAGFVDAYEWVELPNVHGMALYADDTFTTKPYAASGNYINKMSDYCGECRYKVKQKQGPEACPFNVLFWRFMSRHRERLAGNYRLRMLYSGWDKRDAAEREAILEDAEAFLESLPASDHGWSFADDAC
jgi:(6-4)DNA photolyase